LVSFGLISVVASELEETLRGLVTPAPYAGLLIGVSLVVLVTQVLIPCIKAVLPELYRLLCRLLIIGVYRSLRNALANRYPEHIKPSTLSARPNLVYSDRLIDQGMEMIHKSYIFSCHLLAFLVSSVLLGYYCRFIPSGWDAVGY
jgi:hypothetical protein